MVEKQLAEEQYYHGLLPREDIKAMLRQNGDFLVRTTEPVAGQPRAFVLSIMVQQEKEDQGIKHYVIQRAANGKYSIERYSFDSIPEMITHHLSKKEPISKNHEGVILRAPVLRKSWELQHEDVECTKKLGEGAFGEVHKGKLRLPAGTKVDVAIKMAKLEVLTKDQIKEIMREARLMRNFDHPNVVKFYGVGAGQEPLLLVMELVDGGALDSYLQKEEQPPQKKMEMCVGAAHGLEYLHAKNVLHRDIAARNCLYGDQKVKISDFGLTREGTVYQMSPHCRVPIRWLAPETLRTAVYSQKTDVFSYGVLCWEIFANGTEPYSGMTVAEVNAKAGVGRETKMTVGLQVKEGYRMPFAEGSPIDLAAIIHTKCWPENPNERWTMAEIAHNFERMTGLPRPQIGQPVQPLVAPPVQATPSAVAPHPITLSMEKTCHSKKKGKARAKKTLGR